MSEVFISYSRKNASIVHRIQAVLVGAGREPWIDWSDIAVPAGPAVSIVGRAGAAGSWPRRCRTGARPDRFGP